MLLISLAVMTIINKQYDLKTKMKPRPKHTHKPPKTVSREETV